MGEFEREEEVCVNDILSDETMQQDQATLKSKEEEDDTV